MDSPLRLILHNYQTPSILPPLFPYCPSLIVEHFIGFSHTTVATLTGVSLTENNQIKMNLTNICAILSLVTAAMQILQAFESRRTPPAYF